MTSFRAGFLWGLARFRSNATWITVGLALAMTLVLGIVERRIAALGANDRLVATLFRIILPLTLFSLSGVGIGLRNLRDEAWSLARFGHSRPAVMLGHTAAAGVVGAVVTVALLVSGLLVTRLGVEVPPSVPSLAADLVTTTWIGVLASFAYAAWFALGATLGRLGGGRGFVLTADFFIGPAGTLGFLFPKGPVYNLLGLTRAEVVTQPQASVCLVALILIVGALVAFRGR